MSQEAQPSLLQLRRVSVDTTCVNCGAELENLYWNQRLSTIDIAKKFRVNYTTVGKWLRYHGIPIRSLSEARRNHLNKRQSLTIVQTIKR